MTLLFFLKLIFASLSGLGLSLIAKSQSIRAKAKISNVEFSPKQFIKDDIYTISGTALFIIFILMAVGEFLNPDALILKNVVYKMWIFSISAKTILNIILLCALWFGGYSGMDLALRLFSVANKKVNNAIDYKTTQTDIANGTTDKPTPTA